MSVTTERKVTNGKIVFVDTFDSSGVFTDVTPLAQIHEERMFFDWPGKPTPDSDIESGRVHRFANIDDMLSSFQV